MKTTDKHVFFWGEIFSNFHPARFKNEFGVFYTSEQFFMFQKAMFFSDIETANLIYNEHDPKVCKKYGRKVRNFDADKWSEVAYTHMLQGVYDKFNQNQGLKKELLSKKYDNKTFVEASPFDAIWGIKMDINNPDIDDETKWQGQNLLGKVINTVRTQLQNENK